MSMYNEKHAYGALLRTGTELSTDSFSLQQTDNTYLLAGSRYRQFYQQFIRPRTQMYRGWVQGFHNASYGVIPSYFLQRVGNGIINTLFSKPIVLNSQHEKTCEMITSKTYRSSGFARAVKEAYSFALDGGTGLIKWNRDGKGDLRAETVPMDKFFVEINAYGEIESIRMFIATYHDTINAEKEFYLCEERFFRYANVGGKLTKYPMVHYTFYKTSPNMTYEVTPDVDLSLSWKDIPASVKNMIERDYGHIRIDSNDSFHLAKRYDSTRSQTEAAEIYRNCILLPFAEDLGCRLIKFTNTIASYPKMPFGRPLADFLMNESYQYDQLKFFERLEVYLARGRVMVDEGQINPNDPEARRSALDETVFTFYDNVMNDAKDGKPQAIQLLLRAEEIKTQKQNILNDTAFALNMSSSTIAAWLSDGTTQKTATEIEYERSKTDSFINDKIEIIREPLQEMVDLFFHYYGLTSPELYIMPESQASRTDDIRLYSELYEKKQVKAKSLAEKILGTCSSKEVNELADYIDGQRAEAELQAQLEAQQLAMVQGPAVGMGPPGSDVDKS